MPVSLASAQPHLHKVILGAVGALVRFLLVPVYVNVGSVAPVPIDTMTRQALCNFVRAENVSVSVAAWSLVHGYVLAMSTELPRWTTGM